MVYVFSYASILIHYVQCNLNLVTTCGLEALLQRPFFNLLHKNIQFSDIMRFSDNFCGDQKCHKIKIVLYLVTAITLRG